MSWLIVMKNFMHKLGGYYELLVIDNNDSNVNYSNYY